MDFAALSPRECIAKASAAHVIVGAHGAGLMWAAYLPRHGLLVEMFGGNRQRSNRHYHNIASLADLHYAEVSLGGYGAGALQWSPSNVEFIARSIWRTPVVGALEPL